MLREQEKNTENVNLLMDNALSHPDTDTLNTADANFEVILLLSPNIIAVIQPMYQGFIGKA